MSTLIIPAGNTVRTTVTFFPESGEVLLAHVTARAFNHKTQAVTDLTVVQDGPNVFHADTPVPDNAGGGNWTVRFESNAPSPKIAIENAQTTWLVASSELPAP